MRVVEFEVLQKKHKITRAVDTTVEESRRWPDILRRCPAVRPIKSGGVRFTRPDNFISPSHAEPSVRKFGDLIGEDPLDMFHWDKWEGLAEGLFVS